ncbi:MAG: SCO6880 family protein [Brevibacterium aurantiacum]|uniref:SCO6880 family protein n=1 Tax=Brevibacterium aurantiacum TaxID=273384 RepID=UPI003F8D907B
MAVIGYLGGESSTRSFFGGQNGTRNALLILGALATMVGTLFFQKTGLAIGLAVLAIIYLSTISTARGSMWERHQKRSRMKDRDKFDGGLFHPFDQAQWDALTEEISALRWWNHKERTQLVRERNALRSRPDGADGMGWLDETPGEPGIQWHAPEGEVPYFAVTWEVDGQLRGIESSQRADSAANGWGKLLADHGESLTLARGFQPLTRVLPADTARYEQWAADNVDIDEPENDRLAEAREQLLDSYDDLLRKLRTGSMVQRHFITVQWPMSSNFTAAAALRGPGRDGWRELMKSEIASMSRQLRNAKQGTARVLTARQIAAWILHAQNPSRPIDSLRDADTRRFGIASSQNLSEHIVTGRSLNGDMEVEWHHRTAAIRAGNLASNGRTQWWLLPLLVGLEKDIIRTIAFPQLLVPNGEALSTARKDVVRDSADIKSQNDDGELADETAEAGLGAARRRRKDLRPGSGEHGDEWVGYITLSARSRTQLAEYCRIVEERAASSAGMNKLEWLDSYQSAASGCTWPIFRGIQQPRISAGSRAVDALAGKGEKEALS